MWRYGYLLYGVEPEKPTFCLAGFVAQANMNFPSVPVLLKNFQTTYSTRGVEVSASQQNIV